ncbi:hypothetical protein H4Q26_006923 [Puccinia striiformis f. sp. tritici PST-130]|nr:hypothetical protein H4Q26_006923 [Puccinia striiformis f. sp. tritici PST-130]
MRHSYRCCTALYIRRATSDIPYSGGSPKILSPTKNAAQVRGLTKNRSHPLIPRQNERTKTIIDQSKTAASSASFLFGRDGLLSTQSLKNPNDKRAAIHYTRSATMEFLDTSMLDDEYGDFDDGQESRLGPSPPVPGQRQFMPLFDFNTQGEATSGPFDTQGNPINPGCQPGCNLQ